jgi:hypothetical protein
MGNHDPRCRKTPHLPVTGHFGFSLLGNSLEENGRGVIQLVDIGGGHGAVLEKILKSYPEVEARNAVSQDGEDVIALAKGSGVLSGKVDGAADCQT